METHTINPIPLLDHHTIPPIPCLTPRIRHPIPHPPRLPVSSCIPTIASLTRKHRLPQRLLNPLNKLPLRLLRHINNRRPPLQTRLDNPQREVNPVLNRHHSRSMPRSRVRPPQQKEVGKPMQRSAIVRLRTRKCLTPMLLEGMAPRTNNRQECRGCVRLKAISQDQHIRLHHPSISHFHPVR